MPANYHKVPDQNCLILRHHANKSFCIVMIPPFVPFIGLIRLQNCTGTVLQRSNFHRLKIEKLGIKQMDSFIVLIYLKVVYSLPTVKNPKKPHLAYACIDSHTLANLIESMDENQFNKRFLLVDCRYPYEYDGGHIWVNFTLFLQLITYKLQYAVNLAETSSIPSFFFPEDGKMFEERNARVPIFYCEYSSQRGPAM